MSEVEEKSTKKRKITSAKAASSSASIEARDDHSTTSNEGKDDSNNDGEDSNNKRKRSAPTFFHEEQRSGQLARPARFVAHVKITEERLRKPLPTRDAHRFLHFPDFPMFTPNLTPQEVLQAGSFGGTYFRPIYSSITKQHYRDQWQEFPADWFEGLKIPKHVASANYDNGLNTYKVSCGGDLKMWEESGWITEVDPYGWFQWYCRFYLGRRCSDDHRQISRALGVMGETGRWRRNLLNKCLASVSATKRMEDVVDDAKISPKVRQLLQHWGYKLTLKDLIDGAKKLKK